MDELLKILQKNALETPENIAKLLDTTVDQVKERIADYETRGVIKGYHAIVDEDQLDLDTVTAVIEVKVTPERDLGFDQIAKRISHFDEVSSMYLVSGVFDFIVFVSGRDLKQVASFVNEKLATLDGVKSTVTHFMLKTYKHHGVHMETPDEYERLKVSP